MAHNYGFGSQYSHSHNKLPVPHTTRTPNGLPASSMVTIMGEVPRHADRFHINLKSGSQTLLHINPRFHQDAVVRNSCLDSWGPEETHGGMPLYRGQPFGLIILAEYDKYMIAFNGQHFTEFQFRAPNRVTSVEVGGDVILSKVELSSNPMMPLPPPGQAYPSGGGQAFPPSGQFPDAPTGGETVLYSVKEPFIAKIAGGMHPGRSIALSCLPKHNPERIRIDLQKDQNGSEIAMHMDIRFHVGEHRRIICMNNYKHGHWGEEARYHVFPFAAGVGFDLTITSQQAGYLIFANGAQIAFFEHRERHLQSVNFIHIQGDLKITKISF